MLFFCLFRPLVQRRLSQSGIVVGLVYFVAMVSLYAWTLKSSQFFVFKVRLVLPQDFLDICFFLSFRSSFWTYTSDRDFLYPFPLFQAENCCSWMLASLVVGAEKTQAFSIVLVQHQSSLGTVSSALLGDRVSSHWSTHSCLLLQFPDQNLFFFSLRGRVIVPFSFLQIHQYFKSASSLNGVKDKRVYCLLPSILRFCSIRKIGKHWAEYHSFCAVLLSVLTPFHLSSFIQQCVWNNFMLFLGIVCWLFLLKRI